MKKLFTLLFIAFASLAFSQEGMLWQLTAKKTADSTYLLTAVSTIPAGWHLYGSNPKVEGLENVKFVFQLENIEPQGELSFLQKPTIVKDALFDNKEVNVYTGAVTVQQNIKLKNFIPASIKVVVNGFMAKEQELMPLPETEYEVLLPGGVNTSTSALKLSSIDIAHPKQNCGDKIENGSLWTVYLLGLVGGFIALFTPCMFPMIPVTVSFFTKRSPTRKKGIQNGLLYGFFIFLIYALASTPFHLLNLNSEIFNSISTNPILNIIFFIVFIVFAISFFGYFEITLPHTIAGKAEQKQYGQQCRHFFYGTYAGNSFV